MFNTRAALPLPPRSSVSHPLYHPLLHPSQPHPRDDAPTSARSRSGLALPEDDAADHAWRGRVADTAEIDLEDAGLPPSSARLLSPTTTTLAAAAAARRQHQHQQQRKRLDLDDGNKDNGKDDDGPHEPVVPSSSALIYGRPAPAAAAATAAASEPPPPPATAASAAPFISRAPTVPMSSQARAYLRKQAEETAALAAQAKRRQEYGAYLRKQMKEQQERRMRESRPHLYQLPPRPKPEDDERSAPPPPRLPLADMPAPLVDLFDVHGDKLSRFGRKTPRHHPSTTSVARITASHESDAFAMARDAAANYGDLADGAPATAAVAGCAAAARGENDINDGVDDDDIDNSPPISFASSAPPSHRTSPQKGGSHSQWRFVPALMRQQQQPQHGQQDDAPPSPQYEPRGRRREHRPSPSRSPWIADDVAETLDRDAQQFLAAPFEEEEQVDDLRQRQRRWQHPHTRFEEERHRRPQLRPQQYREDDDIDDDHHRHRRMQSRWEEQMRHEEERQRRRHLQYLHEERRAIQRQQAALAEAEDERRRYSLWQQRPQTAPPPQQLRRPPPAWRERWYSPPPYEDDDQDDDDDSRRRQFFAFEEERDRGDEWPGIAAASRPRIGPPADNNDNSVYSLDDGHVHDRAGAAVADDDGGSGFVDFETWKRLRQQRPPQEQRQPRRQQYVGDGARDSMDAYGRPWTFISAQEYPSPEQRRYRASSSSGRWWGEHGRGSDGRPTAATTDGDLFDDGTRLVDVDDDDDNGEDVSAAQMTVPLLLPAPSRAVANGYGDEGYAGNRRTSGRIRSHARVETDVTRPDGGTTEAARIAKRVRAEQLRRDLEEQMAQQKRRQLLELQEAQREEERLNARIAKARRESALAIDGLSARRRRRRGSSSSSSSSSSVRVGPSSATATPEKRPLPPPSRPLEATLEKASRSSVDETRPTPSLSPEKRQPRQRLSARPTPPRGQSLQHQQQQSRLRRSRTNAVERSLDGISVLLESPKGGGDGAGGFESSRRPGQQPQQQLLSESLFIFPDQGSDFTRDEEKHEEELRQRRRKAGLSSGDELVARVSGADAATAAATLPRPPPAEEKQDDDDVALALHSADVSAALDLTKTLP